MEKRVFKHCDGGKIIIANIEGDSLVTLRDQVKREDLGDGEYFSLTEEEVIGATMSKVPYIEVREQDGDGVNVLRWETKEALIRYIDEANGEITGWTEAQNLCGHPYTTCP